VFDTITKQTFENIEVQLPVDITEQSRIASILSSLDDKIELNLQMNKTLEAIAQTIFKEWFVDFRFPGFDGVLVEGLPKGWKLKSFREILALLKDGSHNPPQRVLEGIRFIAGATDIKDLYVQFDKCTYITKDDYNKIHKNWEIRTNDILITIVGTIGNTAIVRESDLPFSLQRSIAVLRPIPEISHLYIYQIVKSKDFKNYLKSRTNPTGQPGVYLGTLSEYFAIVPASDILLNFHQTLSPFFDMMQRNITENQVLIGIRDSLLPKLMTGKIRVA
jgi:type I restriction enzyme S subunit